MRLCSKISGLRMNVCAMATGWPFSASQPSTAAPSACVSCTSPPGVGSNLPIRVQVPGGTSAADPNFVLSYAAPTITDIIDVATGNSLLIAVVASGLATVIGTMAGIAIHRYRLRALPFMVLTPVAMPEILLGVSLLIFFISWFMHSSSLPDFAWAA